ncbi:universal stress protein [Labedella populi]|uniref:Universal stress protein n=1 Tax=Labedella populi TaxID=2498850 RepID=A0A3S3ZKW8_9MICO|nr:universal stress protein [Labedella populi]RWZ59215.1 universal stress protein [Labedella populi]
MTTTHSPERHHPVDATPVDTTIGVGVDGSVESTVALAWALERSRRTGEPVRLVTVVEEEAGSMGIDFAEQMTREASARIAAVGRSVRAERPDVAVELDVVHGPVAWALTHAVGPDDLLVVGTPAGDTVSDHVLGSRSVQVAAAARGPVMVVPPLVGTRRRGVVVGIETAGDVESLVPLGLAEAGALGEPLLFVHCAQQDGAGSKDVMAAVENALAGVEADPRVEVSTRLLHSDPVTGLTGLAAGASLLVLGRSRAPELNPLGTTCDRVLGRAPAPVLIAPIPAVTTAGIGIGTGDDHARRSSTGGRTSSSV